MLPSTFGCCPAKCSMLPHTFISQGLGNVQTCLQILWQVPCNLLTECFVLQNAGAEAAMEWVLQHMEDPNFNDPLPDPAAASAAQLSSAPAAGAASAAVNPESVAMLTSFGFNDVQASAALQARYTTLNTGCRLSFLSQCLQLLRRPPGSLLSLVAKGWVLAGTAGGDGNNQQLCPKQSASVIGHPVHEIYLSAQ